MFHEFYKNFTANQMVYVPVYLENKFDAECTETDHRKRDKALNTFLKRLRAITPQLDEMFGMQHSIYNIMRELYVVDKVVANSVGYVPLAQLYGRLSFHLEKLGKFLNKNKGIPEATSFWDGVLDDFNHKTMFAEMNNHFQMLVTQYENGERKSIGEWDFESVKQDAYDAFKEAYKSEKEKDLEKVKK